MSKFSVKPTLTIKGRKFNGPRGWYGKPMHPPLTDIPIACVRVRGGLRPVVGDRRQGARVGPRRCGTAAPT